MAIKENSADILQKEILSREKELAPKSRICDILITVLFCLFIGGFAVMHFVSPDREMSESENRVLEQMPEFSLDAIFEGDYTASMTKYLSDQFPMRDSMISIKATSERLLLRMENGGIIFGDDALTARNDTPNMENLDTNLGAVEKFTLALENEDIPTIFAPAPRRSDVCIGDLPSSYGSVSQNKLWSYIDGFSVKIKRYCNLRDPLLERDEAGEDVFFRTDHHWNSVGANYAYREIFGNLPEDVRGDMTARELSSFTKETVTTEFLGTSFSSSGASWVTPDTIDLYRFDGDDKMPVTVVDTGDTTEGLYRREFLEVKDKYSVFLGENAGRVDIGSGGRQTIVVIKDSYAQSVVPYFAADFDVVMIDPRYFKDSIYRTVIEMNPAAVIILMNADTLTTTPVLRPLLRGVSSNIGSASADRQTSGRQAPTGKSRHSFS